MSLRPLLKLTPERRLIMTFALRQALEVLQMTQLELSQWLNDEIEKNPLLEVTSYPKHRFEGEVPYTVTLHEHLQAQIRDHFPSPEERFVAEQFLEQLDERGFLSSTVQHRWADRILSTLQTFDPPGIFARNLQESFLLQLKAQGKELSLSYQLVKSCFDDLLHGRYGVMKKKLATSDLASAIQDLARLSLRPSSAFKQEPITPIYPDLRILKTEGGWSIQLQEEELPQFHIRSDYLSLNPDSVEEREALREFKTQANWLTRSVSRRKKLLLQIGKALIYKQARFLDQKGPLRAFTSRELAEKLEIHESTLSRALSGKYISTPRGTLPLRSLLSASPATENARELLEKLIESENKQVPLTDDQLAKELQQKGFPVARRTIAKYRNQLKIGPALLRKNRAAQLRVNKVSS